MADWDGARNLIDLGGLPLTDGGTTAPGRVWRSAAPEWLTDAGWRAAVDGGLTTVLDLRNGEESGRRAEHPTLEEEPPVEVVRVPVEDPHDAAYLDAAGGWLDHPRGWQPQLRLFPALIEAVFTALADAPGGVLVHCAGGRDRTGLISAMLLQLTGVESEAIVENYAAGFRGAAEHRGHGLGYDPAAGRWVTVVDEPWEPEELEARIADRLPVAREFLAAVDAEEYLRRTGLSAARLDRVRRLLLPR